MIVRILSGFILALLFSSMVFASNKDDNLNRFLKSDKWFEVNNLNEGVKLKFAESSYFFSLGRNDYNSDFFVSESVFDRSTGRRSKRALKETSITFGRRIYGRRYYLSAEAGLGYMQGNHLENCEDRPGFILPNDICDVQSVDSVSIPIELTAVYGRYIGIGIFARAALTSDHVETMGGVVFSVGKFN